jgi:hypothetical protein
MTLRRKIDAGAMSGNKGEIIRDTLTNRCYIAESYVTRLSERRYQPA